MQKNLIDPNSSFHNPFPSTGFVRLPQILSVFPVSRSSWYAGVKSGRYPASHKIGTRTTAWKAADILKLLENRGIE